MLGETSTQTGDWMSGVLTKSLVEDEQMEVKCGMMINSNKMTITKKIRL